MADSRIFNLDPNIRVIDVANAVKGFFEFSKGLVSEVVETQQGIIIQARQTDGWKKFAGMDNSVQVQIVDHGTSIIVNIGAGKWIDKAGAATIGMFIFAPLAVTAVIGAVANKKMPEEVFNFINTFIATGGKTAYYSPQNNAPVNNASSRQCPKCNTANHPDTRFCVTCGEKLINDCPKCGVVINYGAAFCPSCGANLNESAAVICSGCGKAVPDNTNFCPSCGAAMQGK